MGTPFLQAGAQNRLSATGAYNTILAGDGLTLRAGVRRRRVKFKWRAEYFRVAAARWWNVGCRTEYVALCALAHRGRTHMCDVEPSICFEPPPLRASRDRWQQRPRPELRD